MDLERNVIPHDCQTWKKLYHVTSGLESVELGAALYPYAQHDLKVLFVRYFITQCHTEMETLFKLKIQMSTRV